MNDVFTKYDGQDAETKAVDYLQTQVGVILYINSFVSSVVLSLSSTSSALLHALVVAFSLACLLSFPSPVLLICFSSVLLSFAFKEKNAIFSQQQLIRSILYILLVMCVELISLLLL